MRRIVIGPPAAGKSTYVATHRRPHEPVIDFDALAVALGSDDSHDHPRSITNVAKAVWDAAMEHVTGRPEDRIAWAIWATPPRFALLDWDVEVHVVDPGFDVVVARCRESRPARALRAVDRWYTERDDLLAAAESRGTLIEAPTQEHNGSKVHIPGGGAW